MGAEPSGSVTRAGTPPKRCHAPRAAEGSGSPSGGSPITGWLGAAKRVPGSNTGGHRSSRASTPPVYYSRRPPPRAESRGSPGWGCGKRRQYQHQCGHENARGEAAGGSAGAWQNQRARGRPGEAPRPPAQAAQHGQGPRGHQPPQPQHQGARTRADRGGREEDQRAGAHAASAWTGEQRTRS